MIHSSSVSWAILFLVVFAGLLKAETVTVEVLAGKLDPVVADALWNDYADPAEHVRGMSVESGVIDGSF